MGTILLLIGADWFIDGAVDLARALGISALVLGVILVGLEPEEMLTAAIASARGASALAVGNVVGTNVTIMTMAFGLSALIWPIVFDCGIRRQAVIATLVSIVPVVLLFTGSVSRLEGAFLLALFVGYTVFLLRTDRAAFKRMAESEAEDDDDEEVETVQGERSNAGKVPWKSIVFTLGGLLAMAIGGPAVVEGALQLAQLAGLSQGVVGATIVDERVVEQRANTFRLSLRTGCFYNPGAGEAVFHLSQETLRKIFHEEAKEALPKLLQGEGSMSWDALLTDLGMQSGGAVRISLGRVTNFADVYRTVQFARTFLDTFPAEGDLPPRLHC